MRVPIRKPGKYTHSKKDLHITEEKLEEYKRELTKLTDVVRPRLAQEVQRLAELGDFSENAEYQIAKGRLRGTNARIDELSEAINKAVVISKHTSSSTVQIGSTVTVDMDGSEFTYQILGSAESDPGTGIISHTSPLGKALMNRCIKETFSASLGGKEKRVTIIKIR